MVLKFSNFCIVFFIFQWVQSLKVSKEIDELHVDGYLSKIKLELVIDNPILLRWDIKYVFRRRRTGNGDWHSSWVSSKSLLLFASWDSLSSYFAGEKVWRCSSFSSVSSLAWFAVVGCREDVRSFRCLGKAFSFFMAARFVYFDFFCLTMKSLFFQRWCFFFSIAEEEISNISSLKSCRCLQAQWWKAKSLLDRWNLPSGYVSSMESNCWASENFLSVD